MIVWALCEFDNCQCDDYHEGMIVIDVYATEQTAKQARERQTQPAGFFVQKMRILDKLRKS